MDSDRPVICTIYTKGLWCPYIYTEDEIWSHLNGEHEDILTAMFYITRVLKASGLQADFRVSEDFLR